MLGEEQKELVGADVDFDFNGGKLVIKVKHVGKIGYANLEVGGDAKPILEKLVDAIEKAIPGDQKELAEKLKLAISLLKF